MFSAKSLRLSFLVKLATAMAILLGLFSVLLYNYISYSIDNELKNSLKKHARYLLANQTTKNNLYKQNTILKKTLNINAQIETISSMPYTPSHFVHFKKRGRYYLKAFFPYEFKKQSYLVLTLDITEQQKLRNKVFKAIMIIASFAMGMIILYAFFISSMLVSPISDISRRLAKMNENILETFCIDELPDEFKPLGRSINLLVSKIKSFLTYKKELFVGAAHELKTPLTVMKTRNQVTIRKKNVSFSEILNTIESNNETIDNMNRLVNSILEFGRAEGAQFEKAERIDLSVFLKRKCSDMSLISSHKKIKLKCNIHPKSQYIVIQTLLLTQIIENILQNAIRFTSEGKQIKLSTYVKNSFYYIKVRDEGIGVDESLDLFEPFRRSKMSEGAGLGLFLVKSASDAIGADVNIKNRKDKSGTVVTISIPLGNI